MAFSYNDSLGDALSRIRAAVGDTVSPGLLPDATYEAQFALTAAEVRRAETDASADTLTFLSDTPGESTDYGITPRRSVNLAAPAWVDGDALVVTRILATCGLTAGDIVYAANVASDGQSLQLATTIGGAAMDLTAATTVHIGKLDEAAATRAIAGALAALYAQQPTSISDSGSSIAWAERVNHWRQIAQGKAGGAAGRRVGMGALRRSTPDYELL